MTKLISVIAIVVVLGISSSAYALNSTYAQTTTEKIKGFKQQQTMNRIADALEKL